MVQQLAASHGIYVVYTSFSRGSLGFPGRSPVADRIPRGLSRDSLEEFWRIFIKASLAEVEACKEVGIMPAGYYNLQTKDEYHSYQIDFANRVENLSQRYQELRMGKRNRQIVNDITEWLSSHEGPQGPMSTWRGQLETNNDNWGAVMPERIGKRWIPKTFLCFDEARELVN